MQRKQPFLALCLLIQSLGATPPKTGASAQVLGLNLSSMDRTVAPGDDFFAYANGAWMDRDLMGARARLADLTTERLASLIKAAAASKAPVGSDLRKIGDCYTSFMDEKAIEAKGLGPLQSTLQAIASIGDRKALAYYLGSVLYTATFFDFGVRPDLENPGNYAPFLSQSGLGMPERSYYLDPAKDMAFVRTQYLEHVAIMLKLVGLSDPERRAADVMDLETRLAKVHISREESGDVLMGNNHWTRADFGSKAPGLDWEAFFAAAGLNRSESFVVWQPSAFTGISALTALVPLETWKDYLAFHAIHHQSQVLPKAVVDQSFYFYDRVLKGQTGTWTRWRYGVDQTNQALGDVVGKAYVMRYFPPAEKVRAQKMVANLLAAFRTRIELLDWMSPTTKAKALAKLRALKVSVGYPDHWHDYRGLKILAGDAFGNAERAERFEYARKLDQLGRPVDRSDWITTPQTVNAFSLGNMNALNFPAAMLQPPYFNPNRPMVMDYGAIGVVIGHEISHSFDNSGALFDAGGKLNNWWTPEDLRHFQASANQLVKQYDAYQPFPDLHINGRQTLGENIADLAGLAVAYDAYRLSLHGQQAPMVQGFTGDQQFFISFAQSRRADLPEPLLRMQILADGHPPEAYRVNTVRNIDAWYTAFQVKPGQTLYLAPADRVKIW